MERSFQKHNLHKIKYIKKILKLTEMNHSDVLVGEMGVCMLDSLFTAAKLIIICKIKRV